MLPSGFAVIALVLVLINVAEGAPPRHQEGERGNSTKTSSGTSGMLVLNRPAAASLPYNASTPRQRSALGNEWNQFLSDAMDLNGATTITPPAGQNANHGNSSYSRHSNKNTKNTSTTNDAAFLPGMLPYFSGIHAEAVYYARSEEDVLLAVQDIVDKSSSSRSRSVAASSGDGGRNADWKIQARSGRHSYVAFQDQAAGAANKAKNGIDKVAIVDVSNLTTIELLPDGNASNQNFAPSNSGGGGGGRVAPPSPVAKVVVGGGVRLFQLYKSLDRLGFMLPGGSCPSVGVSGFTLGGGYGFESRLLGLMYRSVVAMRIVTVTKKGKVEVKEVSNSNYSYELDPRIREEYRDLFWALRGGGNNNFGIVTQFIFNVYPKPTRGVSLIEMSFPYATCKKIVLPRYEQLAPSMDADTTAQLSIYAGGGCKLLVSGFNLTVEETRQKMKFTLWNATAAASGSASTITAQSMPWLAAVAALAGCTLNKTCEAQAQFTPNVFDFFLMHAMSVYVKKPLFHSPISSASPSASYDDENGSERNSHTASSNTQQFRQQLVDDLFSVVTKSCRVATGNGGGMCVAVLDSYGGNIPPQQNPPSSSSNFFSSDSTAASESAAFPHADALYHVQIMGYFVNQTASRNKTLAWVRGVFGVLTNETLVGNITGDPSGAATAGSYRNYPSLDYKQPLMRYYGSVANIHKLSQVKAKQDPLGYFDYSQGVPSPSVNSDSEPFSRVAYLVETVGLAVAAFLVLAISVGYSRFNKRRERQRREEEAKGRVQGVDTGAAAGESTSLLA